MRRFFDTNILVYAHGRGESAKHDAARACIEDATGAEEFVLSTQVLAEFYWTALRLKIMGPGQAQALVRLWSEHDVVAHTPDLILRAMSLHQQHSLKFWDALIVQAALDARCDLLLSEDLQHGRRFGELEVRNPFIGSAAHEPRGAPYRKARGSKRRRFARAT